MSNAGGISGLISGDVAINIGTMLLVAGVGFALLLAWVLDCTFPTEGAPKRLF